MGDYLGLDAQYVHAETLPKGTPVEIKDWEEGELAQHAIHLSDGEQGVFIEGGRDRLIGLLEAALQQAWSLPEDGAET